MHNIFRSAGGSTERASFDAISMAKLILRKELCILIAYYSLDLILGKIQS